MSRIPPGLGSVALALWVLLVGWGFAGQQPMLAQSTTAPDSVQVDWQLIADGEAIDWEAPRWPLDSARAVAQRALAYVQRRGYYQAHIDSVVIHDAHTPPRVGLFVQRGPQIPIGSIRVQGAKALSETAVRRAIDTEAGSLLDPDQLEADIEAVLDRYDAAGYPLAQIRVAEATAQPGPPPTLQLVIEIDEGPALWLKGVRVPSSARTQERYIAQVVRLPLGAPLTNYDPEAIQQRLQDTGLFRSVGMPRLRVEDDGGAVLDVSLNERPPGTFDVALGYLPPAAQRTAGQIVGSGTLQLENVFGGGRTAGLAIDRRPGRVSTADVQMADPYLLGWPVRIEGRFAGEQRDSTFSKQAYHLTAGYLIDGETELFGSITREVTQPGPAGIALENSTQQIPRAASWFTGLGVRIRRLDSAVNPRRGFRVETALERGQKRRRFDRRTAGGDTTRAQDNVRQERLRLTGRFFVPTWRNQLIAWGLDASVLRSNTYDRSDLFRFGGATTLRGYDEDRFIGNVVGRLLVEYRYQIDRESYAYLFGDLGVVDRPALPDRPGTRGWHPGYGMGIQVSTALGRVRLSYALNLDDASPTDGRIHVGLSVGL